MKTFKVCVECPLGLLGIHYVQAVFAATARQLEEEKGFTVLWVEAV